ncbi:MAG: anthranilate phosphoribosyltransferase, partial [Chlamydiia bacterium]|nr:anthranilate phosphoribosyltransferase [Chlamydiia bacterium]
MLKHILRQLQTGQSLSIDESQAAFQMVFDGAPECQIAALLSLLSAKGEAGEEVAGLAQVMRDAMVKIDASGPLLDIVGTGGDSANTVNLSTGSALLTASCGVRVAKHGNRSVSSRCGSADVLEALGIPIHSEPAAVEQVINHHGFGFIYAPHFHPLMARLGEIRRDLGFRTCLNLVGPLLNPARAEYLVVGVYAPHVVPLMTEALTLLGMKRAFVFHGTGTDEITAMGPATGYLIEKDKAVPFTVDPQDYGIEPCTLQQLQGGDSKLNASILRRALAG